ncbi:MAG: hypothetical protein D3926_15680 [Desulfobacteraceae bacterium]|nr:MAG: hypothetical protein D3926_15680 [Desulfobacteraceae bacterium]
MPHINTVLPEQAQGVVKQGYDVFMTHFGTIPKPIQMLSVSPELFELQLKRNRYFATGSNLSFSLLAHIRYMAAHHLNYGFCMDFNRELLKRQGLTDEDITTLETDPLKSMLEERESAMLAFVVKGIKSPASVSENDITVLRAHGWTDKDMVDAMVQGVSMIDHAIMMQVFDMDTQCTTA